MVIYLIECTVMPIASCTHTEEHQRIAGMQIWSILHLSGAVLAAAAICATPLIKGQNGKQRELLIRAARHTQHEPVTGVRHISHAVCRQTRRQPCIRCPTNTRNLVKSSMEAGSSDNVRGHVNAAILL